MVWGAILGQVMGQAGKGAQEVPVQVSQQPIQEQLDYQPEALTIPREERKRQGSADLVGSVREGMGRYY